MAMRAATMSSMGLMDTPQTVRESDSLFRKFVLLLLLISAAVLWIVVWFRQDPKFPLLPSTFFVDASLGLLAGFGARVVLRNQEGFVRYSIGILVAVIGMFMIGALTKYVFGVGPILFEEEFAEQLHQVDFSGDWISQIGSLGIGSRVLFDFGALDWADAAHLTVSLIITIFSLQAWQRRTYTYTSAPVFQEPVEIAPVPVPQAPRARRSRRISPNGRARVSSGNSSARLTSSPQPRSRSTAKPRVKKFKEPVMRTKKKGLFQRKPTIQFAMVEEHRCPYCLDPVTRNDPRGVKECDVCHTLHHADCWAITGVCQVPHLNT